MNAPLPTDQGNDFELVAQHRCDDLLRLVREAFSPSRSIEAMLILAFTRGAAWALDIDMDEAKRRGWTS